MNISYFQDPVRHRNLLDLNFVFNSLRNTPHGARKSSKQSAQFADHITADFCNQKSVNFRNRKFSDVPHGLRREKLRLSTLSAAVIRSEVLVLSVSESKP